MPRRSRTSWASLVKACRYGVRSSSCEPMCSATRPARHPAVSRLRHRSHGPCRYRCRICSRPCRSKSWHECGRRRRGLTRIAMRMRLPRAAANSDSRRRSRSLSTLTWPIPASMANVQLRRGLATPEKTMRSGGTPAASARRASPSETTSAPAPSRASVAITARLELALTASRRGPAPPRRNGGTAARRQRSNSRRTACRRFRPAPRDRRPRRGAGPVAIGEAVLAQPALIDHWDRPSDRYPWRPAAPPAGRPCRRAANDVISMKPTNAIENQRVIKNAPAPRRLVPIPASAPYRHSWSGCGRAADRQNLENLGLDARFDGLHVGQRQVR